MTFSLFNDKLHFHNVHAQRTGMFSESSSINQYPHSLDITYFLEDLARICLALRTCSLKSIDSLYLATFSSACRINLSAASPLNVGIVLKYTVISSNRFTQNNTLIYGQAPVRPRLPTCSL